MKIRSSIWLATAVALVITGITVVSAQERPNQEPRRAVRAAIESVAEQIGLSEREVWQQLRAGETLAEIIAAQGGDVEVVATAVVAALADQIQMAVSDGQITQQRADRLLANLPDVVRQAIDGQLAPAQLNGRPLLKVVQRPVIRAIADETGLRPAKILKQLTEGSSLADIVAEAGMDPTAVLEAALTAAAERVETAVADGRLSQQQADRLLERLQSQLSEQLGLAQP